MLLRWLVVVVLLMIVSERGIEMKEDGRKCPEICPSSCPELDGGCKGKSEMDECGCCPVCLLSLLGSPCGLSSSCRPPLICAAKNETASPKCTHSGGMEACADAECPIPFHPRCPDDSRLVIRPPEKKSDCCGKRGECVCEEESCSVPECSSPLQRVLVREGDGVPGKCCDKYECRKREAHCHSFACPPAVFQENEGEEECPLDSHRPPSHIVEGACCPVQPGCRCRASICKPATCPEGKMIKVTRRGTGTPGKCCDEWTCVDEPTTLMKTCMRAGVKYKDGDEWNEGACDTCRCKRGVAACSHQSCPKPPSQCSWIVLPDGECCPVCFGCQTERLEKKRMNETWQRDDCTSCTCSSNGESVCEKHMCRSDCENPRKVEGQCCPVCDEPTIITLPSTCPSLEHCPLRCENGLSRDDRGCFVCECLPSIEKDEGGEKGVGGVSCKSLDENNCEKQCAHGYLRNSAGCAVCRCAKCPPLHQCIKHCLYGFETNSVGCPVCKCRAMARIDARLSIADKLSRLSGKDKCVSVSPSTGKIIERDGGEWWSDGCRHCFCEQHQEFCSLISCPERPPECPESGWKHEEGACCPSCSSSLLTTSIDGESSTALTATGKNMAGKHEHTVCQSPGTGRLFTDGETWQLAPCVSCTCRVGHVLCRVAECPPVPCEEPLLIGGGGQCCPQCPKTDNASDSSGEVCTDASGVAHASGDEWRSDDCTSCRCNNGEEQCFKQACDDLAACRGVPLVLKGRCCPVCSDVLSSEAVCTYGNAVYSVHEEWRDGSCRNCSCVAGGQTVCRELVCPACSDPISVSPNSCCPLCKDGGWASFGEGSNGSLVLPSSHPSPIAIVALSLGGTILLLLLLALILVLYKKRKATHKVIQKSGGLSKSPSSGVLLTSASKRIGSQPALDLLRGGNDEWPGIGSGGGVGPLTESLLGTSNSECSASVASSDSSGHGTAGSHSNDDLAPLTGPISPASGRRTVGSAVVDLIRRSTPTASPKTTPRHHVMNP